MSDDYVNVSPFDLTQWQECPARGATRVVAGLRNLS